VFVCLFVWRGGHALDISKGFSAEYQRKVRGLGDTAGDFGCLGALGSVPVGM
jgi:hypothetical protein